MFLPISLKMNIVCAFVPTSFSEARERGSSYANVADIREKKPPSANPVVERKKEGRLAGLSVEVGGGRGMVSKLGIVRNVQSVYAFVYASHRITSRNAKCERASLHRLTCSCTHPDLDGTTLHAHRSVFLPPLNVLHLFPLFRGGTCRHGFLAGQVDGSEHFGHGGRRTSPAELWVCSGRWVYGGFVRVV